MKILFIVSRVPYPLEKGDKLRAYNHLKILSESHEVLLVALNDTVVHPEANNILSKYCKRIEVINLSWANRICGLIGCLFNGLPFSTGYFFSNKAQSRINELVAEFKPDHIYCQLTRVAEYVKNIQHIPKTLDYQDAFAKGIQKRIAKEPVYLRWIFKMEQMRLQKYEELVFNWFDNKIIISTQDRENINHKDREQIIVVPNGIDLEFFQPQQLEKKYDLLFTGNMAYPPNIESVIFLVNEVLPLIKEYKPGVKLLIAGADPVRRIKALAGENVEVSGWVDDMRDCYAASRIFIAPMQISIGLQNKLLEAMAMEIPCITSQLANNALGAIDGENIIVCNNPKEYSKSVINLLNNPTLADTIALAAKLFVTNNYNWKNRSEPLLRLFKK